VVAKGELELKAAGQDGELALFYYDAPFPLAPGSAEGLKPGKPAADAMRRLLDAQHYRLAFWREGERRNYRRFFDIGTLAGVRVELADVFEASHALILDLVAKGLVQGLRVDHVDGLADPRGYLERLQTRLREVTGRAEPFYVVVEKILSGEERLPGNGPSPAPPATSS
jgi:(1->4)-alpha-D-glucan 1-alpha-D-glucosylmutase